MPACDPEEIAGVKVCPISQNVYQDAYEMYTSPRGSAYFFLGPEQPDTAPTEGSDLYWLARNYVTVTFLTPTPVDQDSFQDFPPAL